MLYCGAACIPWVIHHRATPVMGGLQCERGSHFSETTCGEVRSLLSQDKCASLVTGCLIVKSKQEKQVMEGKVKRLPDRPQFLRSEALLPAQTCQSSR